MAIPSKIKATGTYRIKLTKAVELSPNFWGRPTDDVVVTGAKLEEIKQFVSTAEPVS